MPSDTAYLERIMTSLQTDIKYINTEMCLLQDKISSTKSLRLSRGNETRLRKFIEQIKLIDPIELYLIRDDAYNWYSDMHKDSEIAITLHSECGRNGVIRYRAEIVTRLEHATEICVELLGSPLHKSLAKNLELESHPDVKVFLSPF